MRAIKAVVFNRQEHDEISRALRWVGLHPEADAPAVKSKRAADVRNEIYSTIRAAAIEPCFHERLERVATYLHEILAAAKEQQFTEYWTQRGCTFEQAYVLVKARKEAGADLYASLGVITEAKLLADEASSYAREKWEAA